MSTPNAFGMEPYLFFDGRCDEAIEFYKQHLGLEILLLMRYKEAPQPVPNVNAEKVMHATVKLGESVWMMSDGHCQNKTKFEGFGLSIQPRDEAHTRALFTALANGGEIRMPLAQTFFATLFGMVVDKFGVLWMLNLRSNP